MSSDEQLDIDRILREARDSNADPKWIRWVEDLVQEVCRLNSEIDELLKQGTDAQHPGDTGVH